MYIAFETYIGVFYTSSTALYERVGGIENKHLGYVPDRQGWIMVGELMYS